MRCVGKPSRRLVRPTGPMSDGFDVRVPGVRTECSRGHHSDVSDVARW